MHVRPLYVGGPNEKANFFSHSIYSDGHPTPNFDLSKSMSVCSALLRANVSGLECAAVCDAMPDLRTNDLLKSSQHVMWDELVNVRASLNGEDNRMESYIIMSTDAATF